MHTRAWRCLIVLAILTSLCTLALSAPIARTGKLVRLETTFVVLETDEGVPWTCLIDARSVIHARPGEVVSFGVEWLDGKPYARVVERAKQVVEGRLVHWSGSTFIVQAGVGKPWTFVTAPDTRCPDGTPASGETIRVEFWWRGRKPVARVVTRLRP